MTPTATTQAPTPAPLRHGNPRGTPNLALRCGAKARTTGCPCRAPAMPNGRCRMHGGKCRGPSTPEGRARMTAANTRHGNFSAHERAQQHHVRTMINRNRLVCTASLLRRYLPPGMAARLANRPQELFSPIHPSNLPFLTPRDATPYNVRTRPQTSATRTSPRPHKPTSAPTARAAEHRTVRAEAAAQAPWRQAIAHARAAKRTIRKAHAAWLQQQIARHNAMQRDNTGDHHAAGAPATPANPEPPPPATWHDLTPLQREHAARLAGLRGLRACQPRNHAAPAPEQNSKSPGRNPIQREPTAHPAGTSPPTAPSAPARPASRQPPAPATTNPPRPPLADRQPETARRNAMQREHPAPPALTPTKAEALRTTTHLPILAGTSTPNLPAKLAQRFGYPSPTPGWRIPQTTPATNPIAKTTRGFTTKPQCPAT